MSENTRRGNYQCTSTAGERALADARRERDEARAEVERLWAHWIPVSQRLPDSNVPVLATVRWKFDGEWRYRVIRAQFAAKYTLPSDLDGDDGEYCEERDEYYAPEGWYEDNEFEETHWRVCHEVTHWMPLPLPAKIDAAGRGEGE